MKKFLSSLSAYVIVLLICTFSPAAEGNDVLSWKLFVGQIFAIPSFILVFLILTIKNKRNS